MDVLNKQGLCVVGIDPGILEKRKCLFCVWVITFLLFPRASIPAKNDRWTNLTPSNPYYSVLKMFQEAQWEELLEESERQLKQ